MTDRRAALPLPVAALLRRARNAKSPRDRHDTAFAAWEAAVRLAVAARPPRDLAPLARATLGIWVRALTLGDALLDDAAVVAAHALFDGKDPARPTTRRSVRARELFDALPAYRNDTIGHAAPTRAAEFYDAGFEILAAGLEAIWAVGALGPAAAQLLVVDQIEIDAQGRRLGRVFDLTGELPQILDPRDGTELPPDVLPHRLHLREGSEWRSLHPWLLRCDADRRERILFFSKLDRRAVFLDFESGALVRGDELEAVFPGVEAELRRMLGGETAPETAPPPDDPHRFGDFKILGKLGDGGMGVVWLARQTSLDRVVALKMLPPGTGDDAVAAARFRREMAALSRCDHANVVKILASGDEAGRLWYAMEYVEGADFAAIAGELGSSSDLGEAVSSASEKSRSARKDLFEAVPQIRRSAPALAERRGDKFRQLAEAMRDAALGLEHVHEAGIVHRDVKPGNLMLTPERRVVVMDLGLAAMKDASRSLTKDENAILGTLRYMPPEQLQRTLLEVDARADVYALGATFYELLTGRALFDGDSEAAVIRQVLYDEPPSPRRVNPRLPEDLATIVRKCVEKDARQRYGSARAVADDLQAWLDGRPISARPPSFGYYLRLAVRRNRPLAAAVVAIAAVVVAALVLSLMLLDRANEAREREREALRESEQATSDALESADRANSTARGAMTILSELVRVGSDEAGARYRAAHAWVFEAGLAMSMRQNNPSDALFFLESGRAGALLDSMLTNAALASKPTDSWLPSGLLDAERAAWERERWAAAELRRATDGRDVAWIKKARADLDTARVGVIDAIARIQRESKAVANVGVPKPDSLETIQGRIRVGEALVLYGLLEDVAMALVVTARESRVVALGRSDEVEAACVALRLENPKSDPSAEIERLRTLVVEPLELDARTTRLLVSPDACLTYVPFCLLSREREVAYVPSGTVYGLMLGEASKRGDGVLALGDPDYSAVTGFPRVPGTAAEAKSIGTVVLLGEMATPRRFWSEVAAKPRWRAVHLACSGGVDPERPMFSFLALSATAEDDGRLTASDVIRKRVSADLVTLAACETSRGKVYRAEGVVGLTRAFVVAGAPRVLASLWKIDDQATSALMMKFYETWSAGKPAAFALREAQQFVHSQEKWSHPAYWAAWELWGVPE